MKKRLLPIALAIVFPTFMGRAGAEETPVVPPAVPTSSSDSYPQVTCTSNDDAACADTLQMAAETRDQLSPLLKLGPVWLFPVHIHITTPDDPLSAKINREASAVFSEDKTMRIEAVLPSSDPHAREFIQRQFVTALLWEKFFTTMRTFDSHTRLDIVPLWLIEGLREWLNDDPERDRESIVRRAVLTQRAPTLAEVTQWQTLSDDRLLGLWQRSFCYYLVNSLIRPGAKRDNFQQWLATFSGSNPTSPQYLFPTEMGWEHELVDATQRSRDIIYTWDETLAELSATETITIPADKAADTHICTLDTVGTFPPDKKLINVLQHKILDLTALELRAHPSWRPILATYRFGLTALINDKTAEANELIRQAHDQRVAEMAYHQKLLDYINWFEVTKDYIGNTSRFDSYFSTAREMERVQADPKHPNPIRANLLQIESQL